MNSDVSSNSDSTSDEDIDISNFSLTKLRGADELPSEDWLGEAATKKNDAKEAIKNKEYDKAWSLLHEVKHCYSKHAKNMKFTAQQTLNLDASVHIDLANILRLEKKHKDAFIHIIYSMSTSDEINASVNKKLAAYFNRLKLTNSTIEDVQEYINQIKPVPDFVNIRDKIEDLVNKG